MKRFGLLLLGFAPAAALYFAPASQLPRAGAAEEYENFLNGLRQRSYFDIALDYLDSMRNSPLLTDEQKQMIPFEEARTSLEASRSERDPVNRDKMLDIARDKFKDFVAKNPNHPQAPGAETQLGAVLVERARSKVEQGYRPEFEKQKQQLFEERASTSTNPRRCSPKPKRNSRSCSTRSRSSWLPTIRASRNASGPREI
ncbi:MAG: hypothetical protein QM775_09180 [Pirellulales bacterium]